jgi:hypothetical protein
MIGWASLGNVLFSDAIHIVNLVEPLAGSVTEEDELRGILIMEQDISGIVKMVN